MELIEFIREYQPTFRKTEKGWQIFTVATQHVDKETLEEALAFCYHVIEDKPILQYPTVSELVKQYKDSTLEGNHFMCRMIGTENGWRPGYCTRQFIVDMVEANKGYNDKMAEIMWGKPTEKK